MKVKYEAAADDKVCDAQVSVLQALTDLTPEQQAELLQRCLDKVKDEKPVKYTKNIGWYCSDGHNNQDKHAYCQNCGKCHPALI